MAILSDIKTILEVSVPILTSLYFLYNKLNKIESDVAQLQREGKLIRHDFDYLYGRYNERGSRNQRKFDRIKEKYIATKAYISDLYSRVYEVIRDVDCVLEHLKLSGIDCKPLADFKEWARVNIPDFDTLNELDGVEFEVDTHLKSTDLNRSNDNPRNSF